MPQFHPFRSIKPLDYLVACFTASTIRDGQVNSGVLPAPPNLTQARTNLHSVQQEEIKLSDTVSVSLLHESESSSGNLLA